MFKDSEQFEMRRGGGSGVGSGVGVMVLVCVGWMVGIIGGKWLGLGEWVWAGISIGLVVVGSGLIWGKRNEAGKVVLLLSVMCVSGGWYELRDGEVVVWEGDETLIEVVGEVVGEVRHRLKGDGEMARFDFREPMTRVTLRVREVMGEDGDRAEVDLKLLVNVPGYDDRMRAGDVIRVMGWLHGIGGARNPGGVDYRELMSERGIYGRLVLRDRGNWEMVTRREDRGWDEGLSWSWRKLRWGVQERARAAFAVGLPRAEDSEVVQLLNALILGERGERGEMDEAFKRTGVSHLLAISGLHVGILALGVWVLMQSLVGRPGVSTVVTMVVLGLYLLVVPGRVPILRAVFMVEVILLMMLRGRMVDSAAVLGLIGWVLLVIEPGQLFTAGFQLSFGIVCALMIGVPLWTERVCPAPFDFQLKMSVGWRVRRRLTQYVVVSVVAWLAAWGLVGYHFGIVSPPAIVLSVVLIPVVTVVLWVGYLKLVLGLVYVGLGEMLGGVLYTLGEWVHGVVSMVSGFELAGIDLVGTSLWWVVVVTVLVGLLIGVRMGRRMTMAVGGGVVLMGVMVLPGVSGLVTDGEALEEDVLLRVDMLDVGSGSCYVLRSGGMVGVYDCGSAEIVNVGKNTIVPALKALGVRKVDVLYLSHPDIDHFRGALDVVDGFGVKRVVTTPYFLEDARARPHAMTNAIYEGLMKRGVKVEAVLKGYEDMLGEVKVEGVWPIGGLAVQRSNDVSLVLKIGEGAGCVLLTGDIQQLGIERLMGSGVDLRARVVELPHHGSMVESGPEFVERVGAEVVLQSTGRSRIKNDKWAEHDVKGRKRMVTARVGAVSVELLRDGGMRVRGWLEE